MIINQEHKAPGFILANEGYDVWFGNCRGTRYGLKHKTMDSDKDSKFWDFSWQHHASFDLPATVSYIHNYTGKSMDYLGHSQGTLIIIAALAEKNLVVEKYVDKILLFGPAAYIRYAYSPIVSWFLKGPSKAVFHALGIKRFLPFSESINGLAAAICSVIPTVCKWGLIYSSWEEPLFDDEELMPKLGGHMPAGTSSMNMEHFGQMMGMTSNKLQKFDYGNEEENFKAYGQPTPPVYNIKGIKRHLYLFAGLEDTLADIRDVRQLNQDLPNTTYKEYKNTGHCTFFLGKEVNAYIEDIVSVLKSGSLAVPQHPQKTNHH
jgi:pimeloyl-ACP methyl ester carboxylesterase